MQFFAPVQSIVEESVKGVDLVLQREFFDIGVNIGSGSEIGEQQPPAAERPQEP